MFFFFIEFKTFQSNIDHRSIMYVYKHIFMDVNWYIFNMYIDKCI